MSDDLNPYDEFEDDAGGGELPAQLRDPMGVWRRQRIWILSSMMLFLIAAGVATWMFPLTYQARATILLTAKSIPDDYVPTTILANILEQFDAIRGVVFTREGLAKIITQTDVYAQDRDRVPLTSLAARLASELTVEQISGNTRSRNTPRSISFEIKMTGERPQDLANVVNTTVSELINANLDYRGRQARTTSDFMQREFDRADEALRTHQRKLEQFRSDHRGGALPEERATSISKLERLEDQRRSAILQIADLRARLERIEARPRASGQNQQVAELRIELDRARAIYTDEHPTVRSLERRLSDAEKASESGQPPLGGDSLEEKLVITRAIERERSRLAQIDATVLDLEDRISMAPEIAEQYGAMLRQERILQEDYDNFLRKLNSAELALSLEHSQQGAQLTRLDNAIPPTQPIVPRWMVAVAGIALSIGAAFAIGIGRELLFPVIIDAAHLEKAAPVPCLGSITEIA